MDVDTLCIAILRVAEGLGATPAEVIEACAVVLKALVRSTVPAAAQADTLAAAAVFLLGDVGSLKVAYDRLAARAADRQGSN